MKTRFTLEKKEEVRQLLFELQRGRERKVYIKHITTLNSETDTQTLRNIKTSATVLKHTFIFKIVTILQKSYCVFRLVDQFCKLIWNLSFSTPVLQLTIKILSFLQSKMYNMIFSHASKKLIWVVSIGKFLVKLEICN